MADILYKEESYKLIGICMEVHRVLGKGFKEIIYKDALEIEFKEQLIFLIKEKRSLKLDTKELFYRIHTLPT